LHRVAVRRRLAGESPEFIAHDLARRTLGVTEAIGIRWKLVWHVLEEHFQLVLVNACHVKQVPGRKSVMSDAAWLCRFAKPG
jgi:hypothetical protein